jgi:hypothetical protein
MKTPKPFLFKFAIHCALILSAVPGYTQTLRQISLTNQSARVPAITITSSSIGLNSNNALVQTTAGLEKQKVEIIVPGSPKTILEVYAATNVSNQTLFDPSTFAEASANTGVLDQDNNSLPFICGASSTATAPNVASSITDGVQTLNVGPGEAPTIFNAVVETPVSNPGGRTNDPNPLVATVLGSGTEYSRKPYLSSGSGGSATTGPQQIVSPNLNITSRNVVLHESPSVLTSCGNS